MPSHRRIFVQDGLVLSILFFYLLATTGPLPLLRFLSLRLTFGPATAWAQGAPTATVDFVSGLNLFSFPVAVPSSSDSCFELLGVLGGASTVPSISRFNIATQLFEVCAYSGATASGENFPIRDGEGYQVRMKNSRTVVFSGAFACPAVNLKKGTNLIGIPTPPVGLSCFDLLAALGAEKIATSQGFNKGTGAFEACTFVDGGAPAGEDFPIASGEAYLVSMRQDVAGFNQNDLSACQADRAPVLGAIGNKIAPLGNSLVFTVTATDADCPTVVADCDPTDAEKDSLTLSVTPLPLPRGASFNPTSGEFVFIPGADQVGDFPFTFAASDGQLSDSETITITVPPGTGVTSLRGQVLTSNAAPLPGVHLVLGTTTPVETLSQADGSFFFPSGPAGRQRLLIDGGVLGPQYATVPEMITLTEGADNVLDAPIFLLPLDIASADPINPAQTSIVDSSPLVINGQTFPPVVMTVPPGAARMEDTGALYNGVVHISSIPSPDLGPRPLPDDMSLSVYIAVQPFGVKYDPPIPITFPNPDGFPVSAIVDIFGLNHDTGAMEKLGDGQVQADGMVHSGSFNKQTGVFTPGGVVRSNSWHGFVPAPPETTPPPPPPPPCPKSSNSCNSCGAGGGGSGGSGGGSGSGSGGGGGGSGGSGGGGEEVGSEVCVRTGDLLVDHELVSYRSLGAPRALRLEYHSTTAFPAPVVSTQATPGNLTPPPLNMSTELEVAGVSQGSELFFEPPSFCTSVNCPLGVAARLFDAANFATGIYPATLKINCNFPVARRVGKQSANVVVVNQQQSPFGVGWSLKGLQRLHPTSTGDLLLTAGEESSLTFTPATRAAAEIRNSGERDFYRFAANKGETVTLRMNRLSNQPDGTGSLDPTLELRDSRGFLLARDDDSGTLTPGGPGSNALISAVQLPATDTYVIVAGGRGGSVGPYHVLLSTVNETPLVSGLINPPKPMDPAFVFNGSIATLVEHDSFTFAANGGSKVNIEVKRKANNPDGTGTLDPAVELRDSRGLLIKTDNDTGTNIPPGPGRNAFIPDLTLAATDTYTVVVFGNTQTTGPYEVSITFGDFTGEVEAGDSGPVLIEAAVVSPATDFSDLRLLSDNSLTRRFPDGTVITFNAQGLQTAITDRNGNVMTYSYDAQGRLTTMRDPVGLTTTFRYSGTWLSEIEDPAGRITRFAHDAQGHLNRITDPDNTETSFTYDSRHLLTARTNPRGFTTVYEYDAFSGRFLRSHLPDNSTREILTAETVGLLDPSGGAGSESNPAAQVSATELKTVFKDGNGNVKTLFLDPHGNATRIVDALGRETLIDRDANTLPVRIQRPNGAVERRSYDNKGKLTSTTEEAINATTLFTYEPTFSQVKSLTDPEGHTTQFNYDAQGNLTEIIDAAGTTTKLAYDEPGLNASPARGLLTSITAAFGLPALQNTSTFSYDAKGNLVAITDPLNRTTTITYDAAGNAIERTDAEGRTTNFAYDARNRLIRTTDAAQPVRGVTEYNYDQNGNLLTLTDARGKATTFQYDARDRVERTTDPLGRPEQFQYDLNGNLRFTTDRKGQQIEYRYDAVNQLIEKILPGNLATSYTYDAVGNLTSLVDPDSNLTLAHDGASRLLNVSTAGSSHQPDVTLAYTYNKTGTRKTTLGPTGTTNYVYDVLNRLRSLINPSNQTVTFDYDALSRRTATGFPNGTSTTFSYDIASQLLGLTHTLGTTPFSSFTYTYDHVGSRKTAAQQRSAVAVEPSLTYTYDPLSQLIAATHPAPATPQETFTYDPVGNRLRRDGQIADAAFDDANRLLDDAQFCYQYDNNGNVTQKTAKVGAACTGATTTYSYDAENRLTHIDLPGGGVAEYRYDGFGRRSEKDVNGQLVRYVYDGEDIHLEFDGANTLVSSYTHGQGIDEPLVMERGGQRYFYHSDGLGSVTELTGSSGTVLQAYVYDSFGRIVQQIGSLSNPYTYTGREFDLESDLYYYRARYYDTRVGRFLQEDPKLTIYTNTNLYSYVKNSPTNFVDPSGEYLQIIILLWLTFGSFNNIANAPHQPSPFGTPNIQAPGPSNGGPNIPIKRPPQPIKPPQSCPLNNPGGGPSSGPSGPPTPPPPTLPPPPPPLPWIPYPWFIPLPVLQQAFPELNIGGGGGPIA